MRGLLIAQYFGAFNDNAWKMMIFTLATRPLIQRFAPGTEQYDHETQVVATLAMLVFLIPMTLVSLPAGLLSDRVSKRSVILAMKTVELVLMASAAAVLWWNPQGVVLPMVILGLMGAQSALFSPAKYGILPEILPHEKLSMGNGLLEMWTMLAIIVGTGLGPMMLMLDAGGDKPHLTWIAPAGLIALSVVGLVAALAVPRVPVGTQQRLTLGQTIGGAWRAMSADRTLGLAVIGSVLFWSIFSLLGQDILVYAKTLLDDDSAEGLIRSWIHNEEILTGVPSAFFGIGLACGAVLAGRLSESKVEFGLIPLGGLLFGGVTMLVGLIEPQLTMTTVLMIFLGASAGLLVVPINSTIQWRAPADQRGAVIALANVFTLGAMIIGSLSALGLSVVFSSGTILLISAAIVLVCTAWSLWLLPAALVRLVLVLLTHTFYRLKVIGRTHVPEQGGALLVPNHVTFVDGLFILASMDRPVRFIVDATYYNKWWVRPFMHSLGAIPISASGGPRVVLRALRQAGQYLDEGHLVCIFAEGQLSRTGTLMPFRRGMERIAKGRDVPIIPVHLDRIWGSIFSHKGGRFVTKLPERVPYPVTVSFGEHLPSSTPAWQVRTAIQLLGTEAWSQRRADRPPLHRSYIKVARRRPWAFGFGEMNRPRVRRISALAGAIAMSRKLHRHWANQQRVGILLPPSIAAATVNLSAVLAGRTSVNLNYTAGAAAMNSAAKQAGLTTVVTSRAFLEKAKLDLPASVHALFVEDIAGTIRTGDRLTALLAALFAPARLIEKMAGATRKPRLDDELTIIFSSGSTGEPKGVVITHYNVDSNVEAVAQIFHAERGDKMLGILPLFHSFGYMTTWLGLNHGIGIVFHPNPLDAAAIGELVESRRITFAIATPTFLNLFMRRIAPGAFGSLRIMLTGAEKLPQCLADAFEEHFGIRPIEGYGATECSPVITTSTLDVRYEGIFQAGSRRGSVGMPLPGVSIRIVDPDTDEELPPGEAGMLLVKGPNIMAGYLGRDDLTQQVMRDGWYVTGDIARVDDDGFLYITDRLSRFSKIGGEMVPHGRVEETLHEAASLTIPTFAVTAVPDEKKGERLIVVHTYDPKKIPDLVKHLLDSGLPNLFIPRADQFIKVDALPMLGTGKLDLRELKKIAAESQNPHPEGVSP
ncbi:MFS transporter [Planctomycetales bacterium ZRK34]|nr:MFS transporter [Planctomycetales bacterium ZRK34]